MLEAIGVRDLAARVHTELAGAEAGWFRVGCWWFLGGSALVSLRLPGTSCDPS